MQKTVNTIKDRPLRFLGVFFLVFFVTSVILFIIDFVPEKPSENTDTKNEETSLENGESALVNFSETPTRIVIKDIGVDTVIQNPNSVSIETLDEALLSGAVRYPGSALLGENATMFLFGHQSYLPVVKNKAFKAFNDLQKLETGDMIQVHSNSAVYEYEVESVSLVEADDALIPLAPNERILMLSTCNSFGDPGERYVVKARYTDRIALN